MKTIITDVKGYRIYVYCQGCIAKVNKDPDKYLKILKDEGVQPEDAPEQQK